RRGVDGRPAYELALDADSTDRAVEHRLWRASDFGLSTASLRMLMDQLMDTGLEVGGEAPRDRLQNPVRGDVDRILAQGAAGQDQPAVVAELAFRVLAHVLELAVQLV